MAVVTRPTDGDTDDRELVARVRAGDDRSFELLFLRYQPRIAAYVRGMVHDHGRAEDVTQEVFISALRRMRAETEREILFKPWIFEIAKNKCIDAFRRTRNTNEVSLDARDAVGPDEHGRLAEPGATPDSAVEGKVAIDNLCGAFGALSPVHHDVLVLRELEGLSYGEIGDRLGMSRAAVESALFRARRRLSEEYEEIVSGQRCLRVQRIVDASGGRAAGRRDQRRTARHLAHCQPCRRYAARAGVDLGTVRRPAAAAAARIAGFLPLPAFLRRRWGADEGAPLLTHGGSVSQWSAKIATVADPGVLSGWTKAAAAAATVAVAGMGAGAAFDNATPVDASETPQVALDESSASGRLGAAGDEGLGATRDEAAKRGAEGTQPAHAMRPPQTAGARPAPVARNSAAVPATQDVSPDRQPAGQPDRPSGSRPAAPTVAGEVASGTGGGQPDSAAQHVQDKVVGVGPEPPAAGETAREPSDLLKGGGAPVAGAPGGGAPVAGAPPSGTPGVADDAPVAAKREADAAGSAASRLADNLSSTIVRTAAAGTPTLSNLAG